MKLLINIWRPLALSMAGMILIYIVYLGWLERRQTGIAAERESRLLAVTAQAAIEHAQRLEQPEDIRETLDRMDHAYPGIDVMVFDARGELTFHSGDTGAISDEVEREAVSRLVARMKADPGISELFEMITLHDQHSALYVAPLHSDHVHSSGFLAIAQPVDYVEDGLRQVRYLSILVMVALVCLNLMLGGLAGRAYILTPLARLSENIARIRRGEEVVLPAQAEDELGEVQAALVELSSELQEAQERLIREMESRRELQLALQERERLAAIGQVTAQLAHEIGSPLQVLMGRTHELRGCVAQDAEALEKLGVIEAQLGRIERTIRSTLSVTRHASAGQAARERIDLGGPVSAVARLMAQEAQRAEVGFCLEVQTDLAPMEANADQIQQIAFNLMANALDWTKPGDHIEVRVASDQMEDLLGDRHAALLLQVRDSGAGMEQEAIERVFETFYTGRAERGGTGLGMAIVRQLVRAHRGRVQVMSEPGLGTTVEIRFPAAQSQEG